MEKLRDKILEHSSKYKEFRVIANHNKDGGKVDIGILPLKSENNNRREGGRSRPSRSWVIERIKRVKEEVDFFDFLDKKLSEHSKLNLLAPSEVVYRDIVQNVGSLGFAIIEREKVDVVKIELLRNSKMELTDDELTGEINRRKKIFRKNIESLRKNLLKLEEIVSNNKNIYIGWMNSPFILLFIEETFIVIDLKKFLINFSQMEMFYNHESFKSVEDLIQMKLESKRASELAERFVGLEDLNIPGYNAFSASVVKHLTRKKFRKLIEREVPGEFYNIAPKLREEMNAKALTDVSLLKALVYENCTIDYELEPSERKGYYKQSLRIIYSGKEFQMFDEVKIDYAIT